MTCTSLVGIISIDRLFKPLYTYNCRQKKREKIKGNLQTMKIKYKILSLLTAATLVLTGCGSNKATSSSSSPVSDASSIVDSLDKSEPDPESTERNSWPVEKALSSQFKIYDSLEDVPYHEFKYEVNNLGISKDGKPWGGQRYSQPFIGGKVVANDKMMLIQAYANADEQSYTEPTSEGIDIHGEEIRWSYFCYDLAEGGYGLLPTPSNDREFTYIDGNRIMVNEETWFDLSTGLWHENGKISEIIR